MALIFLLSSCQKYTCFFQIGAVQNAIFSKPLEHYSGSENMTGDAIQMRTKNLKSMIKIAVNFNIMLSLSDAKIIRVDSHFYDFKIQISAWIFTNYFADFFCENFDFWTSIFVSEIFVKSICFYGYSRNFFVKFRLFF